MMLADTAVILAGGRSSRMGFDKRHINLAGKTVIEHQLEVLRKLFGEIIIVTNKPEEYGQYDCSRVSDILHDFGPLGGIHAALTASKSLYSYIIACDMPCINAEYVTYMRDKLKTAGANIKAVVTRFGDWVEPFNAFYSKELIPVIEGAFEKKQLKIGKALDGLDILYIGEAEARKFSPAWEMFLNINTPKDLERLRNDIQFNCK